MIAIFHSLRHAAFASALLLGVAQTQAALFVDFGEIGAPAAELEPGYQAFSVTNATNYQGTFFDYAGTGLDNGSPVRVTLDNTGTAATAQRMVDRGVTGWLGGQDALLRDWVGLDARTSVAGNGTDTIVRLENLAPGFYSYRSYHTDIGTGGNQAPTLDFFINGVKHVEDFQVKGQVAAAPNNTTTPNFFELPFFTDGSPVELTYRLAPTTVGTAGFATLNGFDLQATPDLTKTYRVDIDSTNVINNGVAGITTAGGWASLNATGGNGSFVQVDGVTFTAFGADGSRIRVDANGLTTPNPLTTDFLFDDNTGSGSGVTVAGLSRGDWEVSIWAWDQLVPTTTGDQLVGFIDGDGVETIIGLFQPDPINPIVTFRMFADGLSEYSFFTRVGDEFNRSRFNAIQIQAAQIPEPATAMFGLLSLGALALRTRRHRTA